LKRRRLRLSDIRPLLLLLPFVVLPARGAPPLPLPAAGNAVRTCDLSTAISLALKNSRALTDSRLQQQVARAVHRLACRQFLPSLEVGISRDDSVVYGSPDTRSRRLSLGMQQLLYDGGRTRASLKRRDREIALAGLNLEMESEELIFSVITVYTEILEFRQKKKIRQDSYQSALLQQQIAAEELRLGALTELEFLDFTVRLKDLELDLEETEQEERLLGFRFGRLLGLKADIPPPIPAGRLNPDYNGFLSEQDDRVWLDSALQRNADLRRAAFRLREQNELLRQAACSWLPDVRGSFTAFAGGREYPLTEPGFEAGVELSFRLPVLPLRAAAEVGRTSPGERSLAASASAGVLEDLEELYSKKLARLQVNRAAGDFEELRTEIDFKIRELLFNIKSGKKRLQLLRDRLESGDRQRVLQKLKLELGEIKRIDFLDAELELAKRRIDLVDATVALYNYEVTLLRLCGRPGLAETHRHIVIPED
jgi:outer membrane protein TolC